jgi:hypothetical protein
VVAVAATAGQSIKMAETTARLVHSAGRLISRLYIGLYRFASDCASGFASGCALVALHFILCVRVCVRVSKTLTGDASDDLPIVY